MIVTTNANYPAIAIGDTGVKHLVYQRKVAGDAKYGVFYRRERPNGKWTKPTRLTQLPYAETPDISVQGDNVAVTFQSRDGSGVSIVVVESTDGGKTWDLE